MIRLTDEPIEYAGLVEAARRPGCGAVVAFLGTVRDLTGTDRTERLEYEAYRGMAEPKLRQVEAEARERWPVAEVLLVHRVGVLRVGDVAVAAVVSSPHRAEAFDACRFAIDRLKEVVPIWKREHRPDGSAEWVDPTAGGES